MKRAFVPHLMEPGGGIPEKGPWRHFSCEEVIRDLQNQGVVLGKKGKADVAEECRFAYKDIEGVMERQKDLVVPVKRLKTVGGSEKG